MAQRIPQRRIAESRPRRRGPVLRRLRQRRLVDLLRPRRHRRVRPRPDAGRLRHLRADLRRHRRHLRRGDRDVPRGRRLLQLRPPRLQRVRQLRRRLGADAQLHDHGRDLGLLRAPLPGRLLARARPQPRRRDRRRGARHRPRRAQHPRHRGVLETQPDPRHRRPRHPGRAGRDRHRPGAQPARPDRQHPPRRRPDLEQIRPRDRGRDDRLHRHRDDLEHVRGGQGRDQNDPSERPASSSPRCSASTC